jgi:hypothetical protein
MGGRRRRRPAAAIGSGATADAVSVPPAWVAVCLCCASCAHGEAKLAGVAAWWRFDGPPVRGCVCWCRRGWNRGRASGDPPAARPCDHRFCCPRGAGRRRGRSGVASGAMPYAAAARSEPCHPRAPRA